MKHKDITILGIESSCDDTSAAIIRNGNNLANVIANQEVHKKYGGVVPELASRAHQQNIVPVVDAAIKKAGIDKKEISAIAYTKGPGLLGSLIVGNSFAKAFAMSMDIPLIEVNHMQAHIAAHYIKEEGKQEPPIFPFICLTVSGGHTQLVKVTNFLEMEILGETLDDAAGEAFDKVAKILGLPYPGGPLVDKLANEGNPNAFKFTIPNIKNLNFSFSGLKTSFLYLVRDELAKNPNFITQEKANLCASIQKTIVTILLKKLEKAAIQHEVKTICIAGGVAANSLLRKKSFELAQTHDWQMRIPQFQYCTDNAAMIAIVGYLKYKNKDFTNLSSLPTARLKF